jgi:hypothetical protein
MLEVKKLKDFINERSIEEGEEFDQIPLTKWFIFEDCFGYIIGLFDSQELNEDYIVLSDNPVVTIDDVKKKYHFENGEVKENEV